MTKLETYRQRLLEFAALRDGLISRANEIQLQIYRLEGRIQELEDQAKEAPPQEGEAT